MGSKLGLKYIDFDPNPAINLYGLHTLHERQDLCSRCPRRSSFSVFENGDEDYHPFIDKREDIMKKICLLIIVVFSMFWVFAINVSAHCEIPCGIYNDEMRIDLINEHIATIEKSITQIVELEKKAHQNPNQLVRWIMNKEAHANEIQHIVTQYFMTQRIKLDTKSYDKKVGLLHQMLIYSMKCKQTTDVTHVNKLKDIVKAFKALYFGAK